MGKKYLDIKKGSLEDSILGVWQTAAEQTETKIDGRTKGYRSHRERLETRRTKREEKKTTAKEAVETESYEMGTDEYREYLERLTPGQIEEVLDSMSDEEFDLFIEELNDDELISLDKYYTLDEAGFLKKMAKKVGGAIASRIPGTSAKRKRVIILLYGLQEEI